MPEVLKTCVYCGRIHDSRYDCGKKPRRWKKNAESDEAKFRRTEAWKQKSVRIRERDHYLCQACLRELPGTAKRLNYSRLSVHHAIPIRVAYDLRLADDNLITLCEVHHEMAERGEISLEVVQKMIKEQENRAEMHPPEGEKAQNSTLPDRQPATEHENVPK